MLSWGSGGGRFLQAFEGALYVRLNPPVTKEIPMDTTKPAELAGLRRTTEHFLAKLAVGESSVILQRIFKGCVG